MSEELLPNRAQRRQWAKEAGLIKKKKTETRQQRNERVARSLEYGKGIHLKNEEANLRRIDKEQAEKEEAIIQEKIKALVDSGMTHLEALRKVIG